MATEANWQDPPAPLRGQELGTFTHRSVVERLPETGRRTLAENDFPKDVAEQIDQLIAEIPQDEIRAFLDPAAPDIEAWHDFTQPHRGQNWLEAPWFFVETYFYRRIIAITGYFEEGNEPWRDPFHYQKRAALQRNTPNFEPASPGTSLEDVLLTALWGNQADLSHWPEGDESEHGENPSPAADRVLIDDRRRVTRYLNAKQDQIHRIDLILDNAGEEILADLALAAALLDDLKEATIHLHAKAHPTFVSDATPIDVLDTLNQLQLHGSEAAQGMARALLSGLGEGSVLLASDPYWTSPLAGWAMPSGLFENLALSDLLIFKGDANYRRLLGDRHWSFDTPIDSILNYLPAPSLLLRTLKSEVAAGLTPELRQRAQQQDDQWMVNGNWGLIQYFEPSHN